MTVEIIVINKGHTLLISGLLLLAVCFVGWIVCTIDKDDKWRSDREGGE